MKDVGSILIIDDETEICFLLSNMLKQKKNKTSVAHTLLDGYHKLNAETEILFLDINLPDGSGLDHLKKIRNEHPELKIIIISAYDGENEREEPRKNGADAFIGKPFNSSVVFNTLNELTKTT